MKRSNLFYVRIIWILGIIAILFESGCQEIDSIFDLQMKPSVIDELGPVSFLSRYDTANIVGLIQIQKELYSIISEETPANLRTNFDGTQGQANANFIDNSGALVNIAAVSINKNPLLAFALGSYVNRGDSLPICTGY